MKSKCLLVLFCSACWLGISESAGAQDTLTVMSYNIYHGESPRVAGKSTIGEIGQFIKQVQPDFVALQEVDSMTTRLAKLNSGTPFDLADSLATIANMNANFGKAIDFEGGGYGVAILSKKKFDAQKIWLPNPKNGEPRVVLALKAKTSKGYPILFAGTHLDHQYEQNRLAQVKAVNRKLSDSDLPVVLAGDFNFEPDSKGYKEMKSQWTDVGQEAPQEGSSGYTYPSENPAKRIDYIWLSDYAQWKVLEVKTPDVRYSDHRPAVATVVLYSAD